MNIIPLPAFQDNYIWILNNPNTIVFDCVDPGEAQPVIDYAQKNQLTLRSILLTHHHHDHIGGVADLLLAFPNANVYAPELARIPLTTTVVTSSSVVNLQPYQFKVMSIPGHTSTHIAYYETNNHWLFCGDTLFSAGCGRVFDGTIEQLFASLEQIKQLPEDTLVFCAHEYTLANLKFALTVEHENKDIMQRINQLVSNQMQCSLPSSLKTELAINPFLRVLNPQVIHYALTNSALNSSPLEVFKTLRTMKNQFI